MSHISSKKTLNTLFLLLLGMCLGAGFLILFTSGKMLKGANSYKTLDSGNFYEKLNAINSLLATEYIAPDQLSGAQSKMQENAIKAYVAGMDDPYTNYLTAEENTELLNALREETGISGIWAVIEKRDTYVQIEEIIKNGPAYKAGLLPLDRILYIETGSTQELSNSEAVERIRGEIWTEVNLFIQRQSKTGHVEEFPIKIVRDTIKIPSVVAKLLSAQGKKIWLFEISIISDHTTKLFISEFLEMMEDHYDGIILDLRGNGGGYLEEASKFLGHFLPKGEVTVQSEYNAFTSIDLKSTGKGELENIPLVVLVDQLTASAGEIIALTLQERGVPIVGMPTFGKGTIQTFTALDDGSSLKYTVGKWFSPQHVNVNGTGILPDFEIQRDQQLHIDKQIDTQLEKAKEVLFTLIN